MIQGPQSRIQKSGLADQEDSYQQYFSRSRRYCWFSYPRWTYRPGLSRFTASHL